MGNPLLSNNNNINNNSLQVNQQLINMYKQGANLNNLPRNLQEQLKGIKGNPKETFYALCKQKGIDPNVILNQFK